MERPALFAGSRAEAEQFEQHPFRSQGTIGQPRSLHPSSSEYAPSPVVHSSCAFQSGTDLLDVIEISRRPGRGGNALSSGMDLPAGAVIRVASFSDDPAG